MPIDNENSLRHRRLEQHCWHTVLRGREARIRTCTYACNRRIRVYPDACETVTRQSAAHSQRIGTLLLTVSRILAATDFSAAGEAALSRAGQIAAEQGAELRIIHATPDWNLFSNRASTAPYSTSVAAIGTSYEQARRTIHWG